MATPRGEFYYSQLAYIDEDGTPIFHREGGFNSGETIPVAPECPDLASMSVNVAPDTGEVSFYDRPTNTWVPQFSFQGS